jgi:hypothetical protein
MTQNSEKVCHSAYRKSVGKMLHTLSQIFFNFRNICVSVAVLRHILQNILQYMTKDRNTYTYITKNLGECRQNARR